MNIKETYLKFSAVCHLIANVLFLIAIVAITICDDGFSAGLICAPLYALYTFASALLGAAGPIIFSIVLWFAIFSGDGYVSYARNNSRIEAYALANGLVSKKSESPSNTRIDLMYHLKKQWEESEACSGIYYNLAQNGGKDPYEYWRDAEDEFVDWFKTNDWRKSSPPLPTVDFMLSYCQAKSGKQLSFIDPDTKVRYYYRPSH